MKPSLAAGEATTHPLAQARVDVSSLFVSPLSFPNDSQFTTTALSLNHVHCGFFLSLLITLASHSFRGFFHRLLFLLHLSDRSDRTTAVARAGITTGSNMKGAAALVAASAAIANAAAAPNVAARASKIQPVTVKGNGTQSQESMQTGRQLTQDSILCRRPAILHSRNRLPAWRFITG